MIQSKQQHNRLSLLSKNSLEGEAVEVGAAAEDEEIVEEIEVEVRVKGRSPTGGPTSPNMLTTHHLQFVKNIMFLAKVLNGVKNQQPVLGKTSLYLKINNETVASLVIKTYKIPCI